MTKSPHIDGFLWDDWNREHLDKHDIRPEEPESVVRSEFLTRETYKQRFQLIGPSSSGRIPSIIVGLVPSQENIY